MIFKVPLNLNHSVVLWHLSCSKSPSINVWQTAGSDQPFSALMPRIKPFSGVHSQASPVLVSEYQLLLIFLVIFRFLNVASLTAASEDDSGLFWAARDS